MTENHTLLFCKKCLFLLQSLSHSVQWRCLCRLGAVAYLIESRFLLSSKDGEGISLITPVYYRPPEDFCCFPTEWTKFVDLRRTCTHAQVKSFRGEQDSLSGWSQETGFPLYVPLRRWPPLWAEKERPLCCSFLNSVIVCFNLLIKWSYTPRLGDIWFSWTPSKAG